MQTNDEIEELLAATYRASRMGRRPLGWPGRLLWVVSLLPTLALGLLLSLALRVRLVDGAWPTFNDPDPKDLGFHYLLAVLAFIGAFVAVLLAPMLALASYLTGRRAVTVAPLLVAVIGFVAYVLVLRLDVGGLGEWFAD